MNQTIYTRPATWVAIASFMLTAAAAAQTADEQSAYRAMIYTPVAALPPLPPAPDTAKQRDRSDVVLLGRLGHMTRGGGLSLNTLGVGVEVPVGRWNLGGTFAYIAASCGLLWEGDSDCAGDIMLGASARTTLLMRPLSSRPTPAKGRRVPRKANDGAFILGFDGSAGFSPRQGEQAIAIAGGLPLGMLIRSGDVQILPFLTPGIGYGRTGHTSYDEETPTSYGAFAFTIGGGIGLTFGRSGLGANVGFQRVLKGEGGATQLGIGMTWQGASVAR